VEDQAGIGSAEPERVCHGVFESCVQGTVPDDREAAVIVESPDCQHLQADDRRWISCNSRVVARSPENGTDCPFLTALCRIFQYISRSTSRRYHNVAIGLTALCGRHILRFAVAKRPVFLRYIDQVDEYVLPAHLQYLMKTVCQGSVEALFQLHRAAAI
jgi:hypothetical protein